MCKCKSLIVVFCVMIIATISCAKQINDPASSTRLVSYSLSASNLRPFSNITYTSGDGTDSSASAVDSTSYWTKTVVTSANPFNAHMEVQGVNNTSATINYTISIYVEGVLKETEQDSVSPFASFDSEVSAVVQ